MAGLDFHPGVPLEMTGGFRLVMGVPIGVPQKRWMVHFRETPNLKMEVSPKKLDGLFHGRSIHKFYKWRMNGGSP